MNLENLLSVLKSSKTITVNLYDENDLLLISFGHPGYDALDDDLLVRDIRELEFLTLANINVKLAEV